MERNKKLRHRIYKAFDKCYWKREGDFDMNFTIRELRVALPEMKKLLKMIWTPEGDGEGYGTKSDKSNLDYISDRWFCQFRLTWMINLLERNWTYEKLPDPEYPGYFIWEIK